VRRRMVRMRCAPFGDPSKEEIQSLRKINWDVAPLGRFLEAILN
jgi:hypothetical protein